MITGYDLTNALYLVCLITKCQTLSMINIAYKFSSNHFKLNPILHR